MAQVPQEVAPQVGESSQPGPRQNLALPDQANAGKVLGQGLQELGQGMGQLGQAQFEKALLYQHLYNKSHADEANQNALVEMGNLQSKFNQLEGKDALDALPAFQDQMLAIRQKYADGMGNLEAKSLFDDQSRRNLAFSLNQMRGFADTQMKKWNHDQNVALQTQVQQQVANFAGLDDASKTGFDNLVSQQAENVQHLAAQHHWSDPQYQVELLKATGAMYAARIDLLSNHDALAALDLFKQEVKENKFTTEQVEAIDNRLKTKILPQMARNIFKQVSEGGDSLDSEKFYDKYILKQEGGKPGQTNSMGATGTAQIELSTAQATAKAHGWKVPQSEDELRKDDAYALKLGKQTFLDLVNGPAHGSNLVAALMYNAGQKPVEDWISGDSHSYTSPSTHQIEQTNPNHIKIGEPTPGNEDEWLKQIPWKQTRQYGQSVKAMGAQATGFDPTDIAGSSARMAQRATELAQKYEAQDPYYMNGLSDYTTQHTASMINALTYQAREQHVSAQNELMTAISQGLGDNKTYYADKATFFDAHPELWSTYQGLDGKEKNYIDRAIADVASGRRTESMEDREYLATLKGKMHTNPEEFVNQNMMDTGLAAPRVKELTDLQVQMIDKKIDSRAVNSALGSAAGQLKDAGIDKDTPQYQNFVGHLEEELQAFQSIHGRQPLPSEVQKLAAGLLGREGGIFSQKFNFEGKNVPTVMEGIPNKVLEPIAHALILERKPLTEENIRQKYDAYLQRQKKK